MLSDLEMKILKECSHPKIGMTHKFLEENKTDRDTSQKILDNFVREKLVLAEEINLSSKEYCTKGLFIYKITQKGSFFLQ